ncbi:MAG: shikimate kinase [bacterium]
MKDAHPSLIVLIGLMGCGKSSVGRELARLSGWKFVDTDKEIEKTAGLKIAEIFAQKGEAEFRRMEREAVARAVREEPEAILSLGGGAFQDEESRKLLLEKSRVFYLQASADCLYERVKADTTRPLLRCDDPKRALKGLLEKRAPFYRQAHVVMDAENDPPSRIAARIWRTFERKGKG